MLSSPTPDPSNCFTAQTIPDLFDNGVLNPDVGGIAVAISNIVINLTLPILLRWGSDSDVQTTILMLLTQVYPIILATATSINTTNLSLFDAHFAITATASPVSIYLVYSSFRDLIGCPNRLFAKLSNGKKIIRFLGLTLPIIWVSLNILISFSPRAFKNSPQNCQKMSFLAWIQYQTMSNFVGILDIMGQRDLWTDLQGRGGLGTLSLVTMWIWAIYVVYHRYDIYDEMCFRKQEQNDRQKGSQSLVHTQKLGARVFVGLRRIILFPLSNLISSSWHVVTSSHPWMIFAFMIFLHWSWILGLRRGMTIERYQLSYGQIMSLFSVLPPLLSISQLLYNRGVEFYEFIRNLWPSFVGGLYFLVAGSTNPWIHHWENDAKRKQFPRRTSALVFERDWITVSLIWLAATMADVFWIIGYVKGGSQPTSRTPVNNPHRAWKPFSISMYIYGYCLCYVNVWFWSLFYHGTGANIPSPSLWPLSTLCEHPKTSTWFDKRRKDYPLRFLRIVLAPVALITCAGPLFAPFAALPLAQQWQWTHACDSFAGEVELQGITNPLQTPVAHFYYPADDAGQTIQITYALVGNFDVPGFFHNLTFNGPFSPTSTPLTDVSTISYNLTDLTFSVYCQHSSKVPCAIGNYTTSPYLSFIIRDPDTGKAVRLRAQDKEWEFSNDAPNFILKLEDSNGDLGNVDIQSAVTKRSHCETLKVCMASDTLNSATLVPLGIIIMAQDVYSQYCSQPRLYTV
ncbi:hypothetical protein BJ912DRAFT_1002156 [Pholiota molesta]|nr:hypothetical protein BJ912DRAFT_1002156 [Pholiota molesta]